MTQRLKDAKTKLTVAVLAGGTSAEREISLLSGRAVAAACKKLGYRVLFFDPAKDLAKLIAQRKKIDVVFPALHGRGGEDGTIAGLLELLGLQFVGSEVIPSAVAFSKTATKAVYRANDLPVAKDVVLRNKQLTCLSGRQATNNQQQLKVEFPVFVKPANEGSSFGASLVRKKSELIPALKKAFRYDHEVLVEEFLSGTEISVGVLDLGKKTLALPIVEICPKTGFFDLAAKYDAKLCEEIIPARISPALTQQAQTLALAAHRALNLRHLSRTDMIIRGNKIYLLETNVLPGMTKNSLFPKMARAAGLEFTDLIQKLIQSARR